MNDPWSSLVQTLSGTDQVTPGWWPARRVYRMFDQPDTSPVTNDGKVARVRRRRDKSPEAHIVAAAPETPAPRLKCPCTNCRLQSGSGVR